MSATPTKPSYLPISECRTVADLLADPSRWIKGANARVSRTGPIIDSTHQEARCWCLSGAICRMHGYALSEGAWEVIYKVETLIGNVATRFNDDPKTTHEDVMAVVRAAGI